MLAIGDSKEIAHPELEFLFTVKEEIGMVGIRAFDMDCIKARRMINMDCGDAHVIAVSSMGQHKATIRRDYVPEMLATKHEVCTLHYYGGTGGHPGLSILEGRACAANSIGEILTIPKHIPLRLCEVRTEGAPILKECVASIAYPKEFANEVKEYLKQNFSKIQRLHNITDPNLRMDIFPEYNMQTAIGEQETVELIKLLRFIKTAPHHIEGNVVITLSGISKILMQTTSLELEMQVRSSVSEEAENLYVEYKNLAEETGFSVELTDCYGGWKETSSSFCKKFMKIHRQIYGRDMAIERVAGGIETGIITHKIPEMDAVGIAPTARGAHTTTEYLDISETKDYWRLLVEVLTDKNENVSCQADD
jgi:dipeptidase D